MKKDIFDKLFARPERARFILVMILNIIGSAMAIYAFLFLSQNLVFVRDWTTVFFAGAGIWVSTFLVMRVWDKDGRFPHDWSFKDYLRGYKADEQDEDEDEDD